MKGLGMSERESWQPSFRIFLRWSAGWLAVLLVLGFTLSAQAGEVFGRVYDATNTFRAGDEITISGKDPNGNTILVKARTDARDGGYRVSLPPGMYRAEFRRGSIAFQAPIQSFPQSFHQDIYLIEVK